MCIFKVGFDPTCRVDDGVDIRMEAQGVVQGGSVIDVCIKE